MSFFTKWGSAFQREPLDQYRDKERTRAGDLARERRQPSISSPRRGNVIERALPDSTRQMADRSNVRRAARSFTRDLGRQAGLEIKQSIFPGKKKDDGGILGLAKRVGGRSLEVLDAASETARDLAEPGLRQTAIGATVFGAADALGITKPQRDTMLGGGTFQNLIKSRGNPGAFEERQRADLNARGGADRLITQTAFDPTNLVGAGIATKALKGAAAARQGRLSGSLLMGAARANNALDVAQARYGRELLGGTAGFAASALSGGDTRQNIEAGAAGVLAGRLSRYVGKRGPEFARVAREFPVGAQIDDASAGVDAYVEALARNGVDASFDADGVLRIADPDAAARKADALLTEGFDRAENRRGLWHGGGGSAEKNWGSSNRTTTYDPDGKVKKTSGGSSSYPKRPGEMGPDVNRLIDDGERIMEVLDAGRVDDVAERMRTPWPDGARLAGFEPVDPQEARALEEAYNAISAKGSTEGQEAAARVGVARADQFVADRVTSKFSVKGTLRDIYTELEAAGIWRAKAGRDKAGAKIRIFSGPDRAYVKRLQEIAEALESRGPDAILPSNAIDNAGTGVLPDGRGSAADAGVPRVAEAEGGRAGETVKRIDLEGNVTDTGRTEAEINRPVQMDAPPEAPRQRERSTQQSFDGSVQELPMGDAAPSPAANRKAKIAAKGKAPRPAGEPPVVPVESGEKGVVGSQRAGTPEGYAYSVPEGAGPQYRRTQTQESLDVQGAKPTPAPLAEPPKYQGDMDQILDDFASDVENYHPNLAQPHDTLGQDYGRLRSAARRAYRNKYLADMMEAQGIDPSDLKDNKDMARALRKEADQAAQAALKDVEDTVLREGFWDPIAATSRGDTVGGRLTGGPGGRVDEPTGTPEIPAQEPPGPREPGTGNPQRAFGQDAEPVDLLLSRPRDDVMAAGDELVAGRKGAAKRLRMGRKPGTRLGSTEGVRSELLRTQHIVNETVGAQIDRIRQRAERAGLRVVPEGDRWVLEGTGEAIEDVVEGATPSAMAARESLTPEQTAVLDDIRALNDRWNKTVEFHGGELPMRETGSGDYFPRQVTGRELEGRVVPKNKGGSGAGGRSVGAGRIGQRSQESVAAGSEAGILYDNPWDALKGGMRNKARMAQDQYVANLISPLAKPEAKAGFGYRGLRGNHPALEKVKYVGEADSGAAMLGREKFVFPNEVADELDDILAPRSVANTVGGRAVGAANSVLTPLRAMLDVSWWGNQGGSFAMSSPRNLIKSVHGGIDTVRSSLGNPDAYARMIDEGVERGNAALRQADIEQDSLEYLTQRGMHYVDEDAVVEFQFPDWVQKVPGVGKAAEWSNETFARFLNYARNELAVDTLERATNQGLRGADLDKHMEDALRSINRMTGWTGSEITGLEQISAFAPRFLNSQFEQVAAAFTKGGIEGQIARRHLMKLLGFAAVTAYVANAARGYNTDIDPRSNNFLRIRNVGGHDISPFGPYATLIRGAAQLVGGEAGKASEGPKGRGLVFGTNTPSPFSEGAGVDAVGRFARSKASPVVSLATSLGTERTYDGRPIERSPLDKDFYTGTLPDVARESIPFGAQAIINQGVEPAIRERDPKEVLTGLLAGAFSGIGAQASEVSPSESAGFRREDLAQERFGKSYDELTGAEKSEINADPEIGGDLKESERRGLERGDKATAASVSFREKMAANGEFLKTGKDSAGRTFTGNDYRQAYSDAVKIRLGEMKAAGDLDTRSDVGRWFALYEKAALANGQTDFEKLEALQAEYRRKNPGIDDEVARVVGARDDAALRNLRKAQAEAADYYAIPAYKGMQLEDAQRASEVLTRAQALSSNGYAPSRKAGLAMLLRKGEITSQEFALANRASSAGANPARKAFRLTHELFRTYYTDLTMDEATSEPTFRGTGASGGGGKKSKAKPAILAKRSTTGAKRKSSR